MVNFIRGLFKDQLAQNTIEYLLVLGVLVVGLVGVLLTGFPGILHQVLGLICPAVDTAAGYPPAPSAVGSCIAGGPRP